MKHITSIATAIVAVLLTSCGTLENLLPEYFNSDGGEIKIYDGCSVGNPVETELEPQSSMSIVKK